MIEEWGHNGIPCAPLGPRFRPRAEEFTYFAHCGLEYLEIVRDDVLHEMGHHRPAAFDRSSASEAVPMGGVEWISQKRIQYAGA